ncbi:MAG: DUF1871 family protein [Kurthia sp.]|nr:DUF1871 family protein [Candidatus Kurthia equi]
MDVIVMNRKAIHIIQNWNPFKLDDFSYETEAADVVAVLQNVDDPSILGKKIQEIFEQSFEQWIPFEKCVEISYKLLALKFEAKCTL